MDKVKKKSNKVSAIDILVQCLPRFWNVLLKSNHNLRVNSQNPPIIFECGEI